MCKQIHLDWSIKRLSDVASVGAGDPAPQGAQYFEGGRYPFVRTQDVGRVGRSRSFVTTKDKVNDKAVREKGLRLWPKGTTLIPKSGASILLNNRVCLSEPAYVSSHLATVIPNDKVSSLFLYYKLSQLDARRLLRNPGYPSLSLQDLSSVRLLLPSLGEQIQISNVLASIEDTIGITDKLISKIQQLRHASLDELLTRGFPGYHLEWERVYGLGTVPTNWKVVQLGDVAYIDFSSVDKKIKEDEIPVKLCNYQDVINFSNIRSSINFHVATASNQEYKKWILYRGDVIFTKDAEIGKISIIEDDIPDLLLGYHLGRARPKTQLISGPFLAMLLQTSTVQSQFRRLQTGVTIAGIRLDDCRSIQLPLPTVREQEFIVSILESVDNTLEQTNDVIKKQKQLQDSLLDELLTKGLPIQSQAGN